MGSRLYVEKAQNILRKIMAHMTMREWFHFSTLIEFAFMLLNSDILDLIFVEKIQNTLDMMMIHWTITACVQIFKLFVLKSFNKFV